ncbi:uncharacterized protein E0L32_009869 [Thyridium curvatum]|uniref:Uncharacterized protein n=1 Tax=Thyridium curvatum TaxID=1093900 RepID=A0A507AWP3_9PEZI|nr:uncharacterized protein E0L32_009869 [Thyridium curvatum]TPX08680.1 hypothetical protein E0L32_009869 [Thyridium curvatum]
MSKHMLPASNATSALSPSSRSTKKRKDTTQGGCDHFSASLPAIPKRVKTAVADALFPSSATSDISRITPGPGQDFSINLARRSLFTSSRSTTPALKHEADATSESFFHIPQSHGSAKSMVTSASTTMRPPKQKTHAHIAPRKSVRSQSYECEEFEVTTSPVQALQPQAEQATQNTASKKASPPGLDIPPQQPGWSGFQSLRPVPGSPNLQRKHVPNVNSSVFDNSDVWNYIRSYLTSCPKSTVRSLDIPLLGYPLQRTLSVSWQQRLRKHGARATHSRDFTACLVFLTGSKGLCTNCSGKAEQPFEECIALPAGVSQELTEHFGVFSCSNCFVQSHSHPCVFVRLQNQARTPTPGTANSTRLTMGTFTSTDGVLEPSRPQRNGVSESSDGNPAVKQYPLASVDSKMDPAIQAAEEAPTLEGETWEFAPGRVRVATDKGLEDVAFSNAYLNHNQSIQISDQVACRVVTIKACTSHSFTVDPDRMQVCFVASGKLSVKIQGKDFKLGPHGLIKINPGVSVTVENWHYVDAKVQITAIVVD